MPFEFLIANFTVLKRVSFFQKHQFYKFELSAVVMTACIAHDIGNPPFGHSGEEAIELLSQMQPMDIVLILSDINMPGMTGFDLLKIVKEKLPELKIFMVS